MKTLNLWLDDLLKVVALVALPSALRNGARSANRNARRAWRSGCQWMPAGMMLAVAWPAARQFRRGAPATSRAELANFAVGAGLMFALFILAQSNEHDGLAPETSTLRLGRS